MTLGIIDVGTNSIHLLVGIIGLNGKFHVILKERDLTRIGEGGLAKGVLTPRAMRRAQDVLRRYAHILQRCQVDRVEAVATSAIREAKNGRAFVRQVRRQLKLPLRIISGREEARLIYLGVVQAHRFRYPALIITIGGGSAQVIQGRGLKVHHASSVLLGCARLAQQFIRHDPPQLEELDALEQHVRRTWAPVARAVRRRRWRLVLGSSATLYQLLVATHVRERGKLPKKREALTVTPAALRRMVAWLIEARMTDRIRLEGVDPRREDLILPTAITLLAWMEGCGVARLRYAPGSLREGLVIRRFLRHHERPTRAFSEALH